MKVKDIDKKIDEGKDISKYLKLSKARKPEQEKKRVNVDFPDIDPEICYCNFHYR